ncbi:thioredoxin family protein [Vibrio cincinnatiensis]|uniref:Small redox-active disulfide protein 2 n=1 Tax=Vibrio cincinnatiensis DSM 19608 TaxID=1123491 RepID=A0A1T4KA79_VIBCI|nr:thioredoxin family protein [Vibrio cincinnatiensis]MCG3731310.1 thioredoxin family protein [Vibrio cincinnatiensis]MCG3734969.1 thioredoxin family protein [Vibrio cincinnatiensis]MCG3738823.1 thioredoxin family protein [Vibrio cincinnatiensis]MCG3742323.1 thioredoxin family protein [Vibrio cincinnatiensis]MCG3745977.1 thioredoxin family protein [Vibrio cincinnatiensis]
MKIFKVLGSGCANCVNTAQLIEKMAGEQGVEVKVEKVTDLETIMNYGVMSTPGVVMDEKVVHAGGMPKPNMIATWLAD